MLKKGISKILVVIAVFHPQNIEATEPVSCESFLNVVLKDYGLENRPASSAELKAIYKVEDGLPIVYIGQKKSRVAGGIGGVYEYTSSGLEIVTRSLPGAPIARNPTNGEITSHLQNWELEIRDTVEHRAGTKKPRIGSYKKIYHFIRTLSGDCQLTNFEIIFKPSASQTNPSPPVERQNYGVALCEGPGRAYERLLEIEREGKLFSHPLPARGDIPEVPAVTSPSKDNSSIGYLCYQAKPYFMSSPSVDGARSTAPN